MNKLPILLLVFKREHNVARALTSVRAYKPTKMYIAADGPRDSVSGECLQCEKTRKYILKLIDWDCEVVTLFRETNLGCAKAVSSAISWFFSHEEYGVIIEEDCILKEDFFYFCEDLLPRYVREQSVMQICAHNPAGSRVTSNEYYFGRNAFIWGWATWRRAWELMDMQMASWPNISFVDLLKEYGLIQALFRKYYWSKAYKNIATLSSWATRWSMSVFVNQGLCVSPKANMCKNIGVDADGGTHYYKGYKDPYEYLEYGIIEFPLKHPKDIRLTQEKKVNDGLDFIRLKWFGLKSKIKRILK